MKRCWLLFSFLSLTGCLCNNALQYEAVSSNNLYHIARLQKGMSEKQVLYIMKKPYKYESYAFNDDVYDIWFYVTNTTVLGQSRMVPQNLTPLTFKNGILVGTGYYWYYYAMREQALEQAKAEQPVKEPPTKKHPNESKRIEEALDPRPTKSSRGPATIFKPWNTPSAAKVNLGMTQSQVKDALGPPTQEETLNWDNDIYNVWFYDQTPYTFKNGNLESTSVKYYKTVRKNASSAPPYSKEADRGSEEEQEQDFNFW